MSASTPRQVFERLLRYTLEGAFDDRVGLYSEDCVLEMPFAPPGVARRYEGEEVRALFNAGRTLPMKYDAVSSVRIHETADPEVIISEFEISGRVTTTGAPFSRAYIMVIRVRDGRIVASRDYANPLARAELPAAVGGAAS